MIAYWSANHGRLIDALLEHTRLVGFSLVASIAIASLITMLTMGNKRLSKATVNALGAVYSVPSLALFAILIPIMGIGERTAIFVLTAYNQFLLTRNFASGLDGVDSALIESAAGMGMTPMQILWRVKLPIAFPAILAGVRLASISTIGIATIAAAINAGGLGRILFDGLRTLNPVKIAWGTILSAGLAIAVNILLSAIQRLVERRFGGRSATGGFIA
jgi:osmoprotectant transport system permease protein